MKYYNLLPGWLLILIFVSLSVFSVGVYENSEYYYYTNKAEPVVDINISAGSTELKVTEAILSYQGDGSFFEIPDEKRIIRRFASQNYVFDLGEDISETDDTQFQLKVMNIGETRLIQPQGDPVDFYFKFDNTTPKLLAMNNLISDEHKLVFDFNEPISQVKVKIEGQIFESKNVIDNVVLDEKSVEVLFDNFLFDKDIYNIEIEFEDLAGNTGKELRDIVVSTEPLSISLITLQNDSSLQYNFDARYKELFDGKIYATTNTFELKIETNKPANCYFSSQLLSFKKLDDVNANSKFDFITTDNLAHKYSITNLDEKIWVACQNTYASSEIVYLDNYFGNNLIDIEVYTGSELELQMAEPTSLVTNVPFSIFAKTNERAMCFYKFDSQNEQELETSDFLNFEEYNLNLDGDHDLRYRCIDVMANEVSESHEIEIDESQGVRVTDYSPHYTMDSSVKVELSLSEIGNVDCRYSLVQVPTTRFGNLTTLSGTGVVRSFTAPALSPGNNTYYIYCSKEGQVSLDEVEIIYDNKGIIISNFTFVNGAYRSTDYIGSNAKIEFEFNVESLIPVKEFVAKFMLNNKSMMKIFDTSKTVILGDFSNVDKITIYSINELDVNRSYEKTIKYDSTAPIVMINDAGGGKTIVCNDPESGCAQTLYGFAQTSIECRANANYDNSNNSILDVAGKNYLCIESFNNANLREFKIESLQGAQPLGNMSLSSSFAGNQSQNTTSQNSDDNSDNSDDNDIEPWQPSSSDGEDSNIGTISIIAAIVAILAGTGGGGYYAYKKGYLDKELEKLGIHIPSKNNKNSSTTTSISQGAKFTSKPIKNETPVKNLKKSGYNHHLKKLNKFIDDKMSKSSGTFEAFDESNKGKVKGYKDTLVHNQNKSKVSKEDFDEFYEKSRGSKQSGSKENLEKEAESFEKYYQNKKIKTTKNNKNN